MDDDKHIGEIIIFGELFHICIIQNRGYMVTHFTNNEELLNNDISEIASINRMYYICYLICVAFVDIIGFHVYWVVDKEWNVIDPLFYFLSTLVPALVCYWLYVALGSVKG